MAKKKKNETPKTTKPAAAPKTEAAPKVKPLSEQRVKVLKLISKSKAGQLTRKEISDALEISSGFCSLLGHTDATKVEPGSMIGQGLLKLVLVEGEQAAYALTAEGKKTLAKLDAKPAK